jgi:caa(3)-type oxidase subunit IV
MAHDDHSNHSHDENQPAPRHHHILPVKMALAIYGVLLFLTALTIIISRVDLGMLNFSVAMLVATVKALLVILFFMGLLYDVPENSFIFSTAFIFLAIFITLTASDVFFRGNVYVKPGDLTAGASTKSKLKSPWISTPELVAHGKELFEQNCVTCHGPEGMGNGVAAAGLNPPPRNFHGNVGWKNGRKPSDLFKTLKEGVTGSGMASFATLPVDDRWALIAFVETFNPEKPPAETPDDLTKIGYNLQTGLAEGGAEKEEKTIPVDFALDLMAQPEEHPTLQAAAGGLPDAGTAGGQIYEARCAECHGQHAEGGIRVASLGGLPKAYLTTSPLSAGADFDSVVINGLPGSAMPGSGDLSGAELSEVYGYVKSLAARR